MVQKVLQVLQQKNRNTAEQLQDLVLLQNTTAKRLNLYKN